MSTIEGFHCITLDIHVLNTTAVRAYVPHPASSVWPGRPLQRCRLPEEIEEERKKIRMRILTISEPLATTLGEELIKFPVCKCEGKCTI